MLTEKAFFKIESPLNYIKQILRVTNKQKYMEKVIGGNWVKCTWNLSILNFKTACESVISTKYLLKIEDKIEFITCMLSNA